MFPLGWQIKGFSTTQMQIGSPVHKCACTMLISRVQYKNNKRPRVVYLSIGCIKLKYSNDWTQIQLIDPSLQQTIRRFQAFEHGGDSPPKSHRLHLHLEVWIVSICPPMRLIGRGILCWVFAPHIHTLATKWSHPKDTFAASFVPVSWRCIRVIFVGEGVVTGIAAGLDFFFRQFNLQEHYHKITMLGLNTSAIKGLLIKIS